MLQKNHSPNYSGKAIVRAVRAHLLVDAVLNTLIRSKALGVSIPDLEVEANAPDMNDARAEEEAIPGTPALSFKKLMLRMLFLFVPSRQSHCQTLVAVHGHGRHSEKIHQSRTHWILGTAS